MLARLVFAAALFAGQEDTAGSSPRAAIPAAVMRNAAAVCRVQCGSSIGSGCYLGDGLALTCRHLFDGEGNRAGVATFPDGRRYGWTLRALLSEWDAALIEFSARPVRLRGVRIARNNPTRGQRLYMAGWSTGRAGFRAGLFRRTVGRPGGQMLDWGQMERSGHGSAQSGDSGGPVFTAAGKLCGNLWGSDGQSTTFLMPGRLHRFLLPHNARLARWHAALARGWCPPSWGSGKGSAVTVPSNGRPTPVPAPEAETPTPTPPAAAAVTLTDADLDKIAARIFVRMQNNPAPFRGVTGPTGPAGPPAKLADLPPVVLEIHDRGTVYRQSRPLGQPIKIEVTGALNAAGR